ncbi:MAG: hypothetical protein OCU18_06905, partial [Candidatus Syntrophoarchaeum sp.]|nr:hypothetical protein [Candidatus Syntrophoarchaeum sp.]
SETGILEPLVRKCIPRSKRRYTGRRCDTMRSIVAVPVSFQVMVERGECGWSLIVQGSNDRVKEIMKIEENPLYIIPVGRVI